MKRSVALLFLTAAVVATAQDKKDGKKSAAPRLTVALPLTVEPGKTVKLTVRGTNLDGVTGVRVSTPGAKGKLLGGLKKDTLAKTLPTDRIGEWSVGVEVELPRETKGDTVTVTLVGPGGESNPVRLAVADDTPRVVEKEPNEGFATAQPVPVPCVVEGVIGREKDVDVFKFAGKAGEKVKVEIEAARLGSPLEAILTVYDPAGRVLGADATGAPDPAVAVTLPRDGPYCVAVIDANDFGGPAFAYRLVVRK